MSAFGPSQRSKKPRSAKCPKYFAKATYTPFAAAVEAFDVVVQPRLG
jgi:hypothetical protein